MTVGCPHSMHGDPASCSQCRGAVPKIATIGANGARFLDGVPFVADATKTASKAKASRVKGGARSKRTLEVPDLIVPVDIDPDDT